jgi:hypothetical protein
MPRVEREIYMELVQAYRYARKTKPLRGMADRANFGFIRFPYTSRCLMLLVSSPRLLSATCDAAMVSSRWRTNRM